MSSQRFGAPPYLGLGTSKTVLRSSAPPPAARFDLGRGVGIAGRNLDLEQGLRSPLDLELELRGACRCPLSTQISPLQGLGVPKGTLAQRS